MARRTIIEASHPPKLVIPRQKAEDLLNKQLDKGKELQDITINSEQEYDQAEGEKERWRDYTEEVLQRSFDNDSIRRDFATAYGAMRMAGNLYDMVDNYRNDINAKVNKLQSIIEKLELIPEPNELAHEGISSNRPEKEAISKDVFLVHGHDHEMKMNVARFIEGAGLNPIILHEQPNEGRTIIEKLEHNSSVGFAVVLMTPDDIGYKDGDDKNARPRARQNVIAELGFFVGKLTRKNVAVLFDTGVELPSDFLGVVYISIDAEEGWKLKLAREIKNAGLPIDLNRII